MHGSGYRSFPGRGVAAGCSRELREGGFDPRCISVQSAGSTDEENSRLGVIN
jgi:hypothetical protein